MMSHPADTRQPAPPERQIVTTTLLGETEPPRMRSSVRMGHTPIEHDGKNVSALTEYELAARHGVGGRYVDDSRPCRE